MRRKLTLTVDGEFGLTEAEAWWIDQETLLFHCMEALEPKARHGVRIDLGSVGQHVDVQVRVLRRHDRSEAPIPRGYLHRARYRISRIEDIRRLFGRLRQLEPDIALDEIDKLCEAEEEASRTGRGGARGSRAADRSRKARRRKTPTRRSEPARREESRHPRREEPPPETRDRAALRPSPPPPRAPAPRAQPPRDQPSRAQPSRTGTPRPAASRAPNQRSSTQHSSIQHSSNQHASQPPRSGTTRSATARLAKRSAEPPPMKPTVDGAFSPGSPPSVFVRLGNAADVRSTLRVGATSAQSVPLKIVLKHVSQVLLGDEVTLVLQMPDRTFLQLPARVFQSGPGMTLIQALVVRPGVLAEVRKYTR